MTRLIGRIDMGNASMRLVRRTLMKKPRRATFSSAVTTTRTVESFRWPAAIIACVALIVRVVHVWQIRHAPFFDALMGDARGYDQWAVRLAGGNWFGGEVFYQAPLYPY